VHDHFAQRGVMTHAVYIDGKPLVVSPVAASPYIGEGFSYAREVFPCAWECFIYKGREVIYLGEASGYVRRSRNTTGDAPFGTKWNVVAFPDPR
jgi:hypothetical protein